MRSRQKVFALTLLLLAPLLSPHLLAAEPVDIKGPDVTIIAEKERTVFEFRQGGVLRMVRVEPSWGKPYYLVPMDNTSGEVNLERAETLFPSWVLVEF